MADIYVCSHGQTKPCDLCSRASVVAPEGEQERWSSDGCGLFRNGAWVTSTAVPEVAAFLARRLNQRTTPPETPVVARELISRLIKLAAAVIAGHDFISPYADDNPKTTPRAILHQAEKQCERLRLWAIEIRGIADKLSAAIITRHLAGTTSVVRNYDDAYRRACAVLETKGLPVRVGNVVSEDNHRLAHAIAIEFATTTSPETPVGGEAHYLPNWLWCGRCKAWIETAHQCGAQYIDKGTHFELVKPAAPVVSDGDDEGDEFERRATEIVGTVFDNTSASHETLKQTMIERITDYLTDQPVTTGWQYVHERDAELIRKDGMMCEAHPGLELGHDPNCGGPGLAWSIEGRTAIEALLTVKIQHTKATAIAILESLNFDTSLDLVHEDIARVEAMILEACGVQVPDGDSSPEAQDVSVTARVHGGAPDSGRQVVMPAPLIESRLKATIERVIHEHHLGRTHNPTYCCPEDETVYDRMLVRRLVEELSAAPVPAAGDDEGGGLNNSASESH